jgi:alkylation response protein AidB-like acyl-CoA dehydrogenase
VQVPEASRLQGGNSFRDTAKVLKMTRYAVDGDRVRNGRLRGRRQAQPGALAVRQADRLVPAGAGSPRQHHGITVPDRAASSAACRGEIDGAHAALSKAFCTAKCRETVAWARELLGGNGIVADYKVARFFTDVEALYFYEGTYQMQNLIVGKAITEGTRGQL